MKKKVFISWSGARSQSVALALRSWLPDVVHNVVPFVSEEDIAKGDRGMGVISSELKDAAVGIICLTPENVNASWILFEAGALSNSLGASNRVCPILIGMKKADIKQPLAQFQLTSTDKEDMYKLVEAINSRFDLEYRASDADLRRRFERSWSELEGELEAQAKSVPKGIVEHRSQEEILHEILDLVRQMRPAQEKKPPETSGPPPPPRPVYFDKGAENDESSHISPGCTVSHSLYGDGKVVSIFGKGSDKMVVVSFDDHGQDVLFLKDVKLRVGDPFGPDDDLPF